MLVHVKRIVDSTRRVAAYELNARSMGLPLLLLMENAGRSVADEIDKRLGGVEGKRIVVFSGKGGNAGDGFVAARHLASRGARVEVLLFYPKELIAHPDAKLNLLLLEKMDRTVKLVEISDLAGLKPVKADALVDALLGLGVKGRIKEPLKTAITVFNQSSGLKVSIDVPSGLDPDTGQPAEPTVVADVTVTMHFVKPGLVSSPAKRFVGDLVIAETGQPPESVEYVGPGDIRVLVPAKPVNAHKGSGGRVLVIGGSRLYSGAPAMTALAVLRSGGDLAYVAAPESVANVIASYSPTLIVHKLRGEKLSGEHVEELISFIEKRVESVVVGPGLGLHEDTRRFTIGFIERIVEEKNIKGVVVDADALKHLSEARPHLDLRLKAILTPHAGEASIMLGWKVGGELASRVKAAIEIARSYNSVVLLKGPVDVVAEPTGRYRLNKTGTPGMSTGGTGDVLAGILSVMVARGVELFDAACIAAYVSGRAGELASKVYGERITALDVIDRIPEAFKVE
jgi:NAD(P)H-hydrate epimerase